MRADGSGTVQLTGGAEGETSPRWSPDGKAIAFIAKREDEANAIYLMPADGGEGRALTKHSSAISRIAWSPDGSAIYFTAPEEKTAEEKDRDKNKDDVFAFDEDYKQPHLWKVTVADRREQRITSGDYAVNDFELTRDGKRVVIHRAPNPLYGYSDEGEVWIMNADGSGGVQLTKNHVPEDGAEASPDGSTVLFLSQSNEKFEPYFNRKIFLVPSGGGAARVLTADLPYEVERAAWSKDGRAVFFLANMGVHAELFRLDVATGKSTQLTDGQHTVTSWWYSPSADRHVFSIDEPTNPGELYTLPASGGASPTAVTHVFAEVAREFKLPRQEKLEWKGADGVTVEGILFTQSITGPARNIRSWCKRTAGRRLPTSSASGAGATTLRC